MDREDQLHGDPVSSEETLTLSQLIEELLKPLHDVSALANRIRLERRNILERRIKSVEPQPIDADAAANPEDLALARAKQEMNFLQARQMCFPNDHLFGDPAWAMLVDIYVRQRSGLRTMVSSACIASGAPPTTALRYLKTLVDEGWLLRHPDPDDARRVFVELTQETMKRLTNLLATGDRLGSRLAT